MHSARLWARLRRRRWSGTPGIRLNLSKSGRNSRVLPGPPQGFATTCWQTATRRACLDRTSWIATATTRLVARTWLGWCMSNQSRQTGRGINGTRWLANSLTYAPARVLPAESECRDDAGSVPGGHWADCWAASGTSRRPSASNCAAQSRDERGQVGAEQRVHQPPTPGGVRNHPGDLLHDASPHEHLDRTLGAAWGGAGVRGGAAG